MPKKTVTQTRKVRVGGIVLDSKNNLLIVFGRESRKWSLPKGALDPEESHLEGALREIWEESGLKLKPNEDKPQHWSINKAVIYLLKVQAHRPKAKPKDKREVMKANWLNLQDLSEIEQIKKHSNKMLIAAIDRILNHLPPPINESKQKITSIKVPNNKRKSKNSSGKPILNLTPKFGSKYKKKSMSLPISCI